MEFHEVRFPERLSVGSTGGPERRTDIVSLVGGREERNAPRAHSRRRFDAGVAVGSLDDVHEVIAFFEARRGQLHGFRWKDWLDFKSCAPSAAPSALDQAIGVGDGTTQAFQLTKRYEFGPEPYDRPIRKPVAGTVLVAVDGAARAEGLDFTLDAASGIVTLLAPPPAGAAITAGFEFDVPVRFDVDRIEASLSAIEAGEIPSIPLVEVRV